jgi:hypothetical protein
MAPPRLIDLLGPAERQHLEADLVDFDCHWHPHKLAERMAVLPAVGQVLRLPALVELVKIDLERHWQQGNRRGLDGYLEGYPELAVSDAALVELLEAECRVRRQFGATVAWDELARRFPGRAAEIERWRREDPDAGTAPFAAPRLTGPAGARMIGRYRVLRPLGAGNMGSVFLAHDTLLDREVALKVPHFTAEDGPEVRARFLREGQALAALNHPNLCPVYDAGEADGVPYLAMAFVAGESLAQRCRDRVPWPQQDAVALVRRLALALAAVHDRGIIHRDLKPANILLTPAGEPVIVDFGLAHRSGRDETRMTAAGAVVGTPAYMAPEQAAGNAAAPGPGTDLYSLGVLLYELLTGRLPFEGTLVEVLMAIRERTPAPVSVHRPDVDPTLEAVCARALAKRPADRYPGMREFAAALAGLGATASLPAGARLLPGTRPVWRRPARLGAALVLLAGLGVTAWLVGSQMGGVAEPSPATTARGTVGGHPVLPAPAPQPVEVRRFQGHTAAVVGAAFALEGEAVVSASADHTVRFWDAATGAERVDQRWHFDEATRVRALAPDGRAVVTNMLQSVALWTVPGRARVLGINTEAPHVDVLAVSRGGRFVVAGLREAFGAVVLRVWDVENSKSGASWKVTGEPIACAAVSPDGSRVLTGDRDGVRLWDVDGGKELLRRDVGSVCSVAFSPDGTGFLVGGVRGTVSVWQADHSKPPVRFEGHLDAVWCLAWSAEGTRFLSGSEDRTARLWDLQSGKELGCLRGPAAAVTAAALVGDRMLTGSKDGDLRLWEMRK